MGFVENARIIVADSKESSRKQLRECLKKYGFQVQAEARNAPDLLRKARTIYPDLAVIDSNLEGGSIFEIAGILQEDEITQVLIVADNYNVYLREFAHILKPYAPDTLISAVEICLFYNSRFNTMRKQVTRLQEDLRTRKLVDQAKGIMMEKWGMSEGEAYRSLQKESMNRGMSMKEIARAVIETNKDYNE